MAYPKYTGNVLFGGVYDVGVAYRTNGELLVTHVEHLGHVDRGGGVAVVQVVQEQLEVTDHHELTDPALFDASHLGHFDVALVSRTNTPGRVDAQRSFC